MAKKRSSAPSGPVGSETAPEAVCRCGVGPHPELGDRCAAGHVLKGNALALVVGARSAAFWNEHSKERWELREAIVSDAGHTSGNAPRALELAADGLAQAVLVRDSAFLRLVDSGGPVTSSGRTRRIFTVWCSAADRVERHLRLVGLKRQLKPAPTLAEVMAAGDE